MHLKFRFPDFEQDIANYEARGDATPKFREHLKMIEKSLAENTNGLADLNAFREKENEI